MSATFISYGVSRCDYQDSEAFGQAVLDARKKLITDRARQLFHENEALAHRPGLGSILPPGECLACDCNDTGLNESGLPVCIKGLTMERAESMAAVIIGSLENYYQAICIYQR